MRRDCKNTFFFGLHLVSSDDYKYVLNAHGDVVALVNASGTITKRYEYDAFGVELNPDETDTNPYRYCAEYFDVESGTIYLRARYYSPNHGRFTQLDPARDGLNWYAYCANNPILFVDPWGLVLSVPEFDDGSHDKVMEYLQKLTNHKLVRENGKVRIAERATDSSLSAGDELIERIINSEFTCTVALGKSGSNGTLPSDTEASQNGTGCNAIVNIYLDTADDQMATYSDDVFGTLENSGRPLYIALAHELIHADRDMRGVSLPNVEDTEQYYDYYNKATGKIEQHHRKTIANEMQTIGIYVKGHPLDELSITENQIRMEHRLPLRGAHFRAR